MAGAGFSAIVSVATAATSATYSVTDGIKQFSIGDSNDLLDITDFADSRLRRRIAGLRDVQIDLDGDLEITSAAYLKLRAAYEAGTAVGIQILYDGTNGVSYSMIVESLERSGAVDGLVEVSVSLQHEGSVDPIVIGSGL